MKTKTMILAFALAFGSAWQARADEPAIDLDVQAPGFDATALRARLAADLGLTVVAPGLGAKAHLFVTEINGKIIVGLSQGTRQVTRQVELSSEHAVAAETLELLLVAMMRHESTPPVVQPVAPPPAPVVVTPRATAPPPPVAAEREYTMPVAIDLAPFVGFAFRVSDVP